MAKPLEHNPNSTQNTASTKQYPDENAPQKGASTKKKRFMPPDFSISLSKKGGTDSLFHNPPTQRQQNMQAFEEIYTDIINYIVRITHKIWEEKDIGYIYETYHHKEHVYDDFGLQYEPDKIVAETVHTINAFPDCRLFADEAIWAGDDKEGFHTSHRVIITGTNTGWGRFALSPTFRKMRVICIANCICFENELFEECVLYDHYDLLHQIGIDLWEMAKKWASDSLPPALGDTCFGENERLPGQDKPTHLPLNTAHFDIEDFITYHLYYIWNWRMLFHVNKAYSPTIRFHGVNGSEDYGIGAVHFFILSILALFPYAMMQIDDIYWMGNEEEGYLVAVRWSLIGSHSGYGIYGMSTHKPINMLGLSQYRINDEKIIEEWTLFNEIGILMQLER